MSYPSRSGRPSAVLVMSLCINILMALCVLGAVVALRPPRADPLREELRECYEALLRHPEAFEAHREGPGEIDAEERLRRRLVELEVTGRR